MQVYDPHSRGERLVIPSVCGRQMRWQVSAFRDQAESNLSAPFVYDPPRCALRAEVKWESITLSHRCPEDAWYQISANRVKQEYWNDQFRMPVKCGANSFYDLSGYPDFEYLYHYPSPDTLTVPLEPPDYALTLGQWFLFVDHWGDASPFASVWKTLKMPYAEWLKYDQTILEHDEYVGIDRPVSDIRIHIRGLPSAEPEIKP